MVELHILYNNTTIVIPVIAVQIYLSLVLYMLVSNSPVMQVRKWYLKTGIDMRYSFIPKATHCLNCRRLGITLTCMNEQIGDSAGCQVGLNCIMA